MNQEQLDGFLTARGRSRRRLAARRSGFMGALAGIGPWFTKLARATDSFWNEYHRRKLSRRKDHVIA